MRRTARSATGARANAVIGVIHANALVGLSYGWWMDKHNRHHAHPNDAGPGPRCGRRGAGLHPCRRPAGGAASAGRWCAIRPGFFPLLLLQAVSLHVNSVAWLARQADGRLARPAARHARRRLARHCCSCSPRCKALAFAVVHQGLLGVYLGWRSRPTTRACRSRRGATRWTSCAARSSPLATCVGGRFVDLGARRAELPDRAPPVPEHAAGEPEAGPAARAGLLRRDRSAYRECGLSRSYRQALRHLDAMGVSAPVPACSRSRADLRSNPGWLGRRSAARPARSGAAGLRSGSRPRRPGTGSPYDGGLAQGRGG